MNMFVSIASKTIFLIIAVLIAISGASAQTVSFSLISGVSATSISGVSATSLTTTATVPTTTTAVVPTSTAVPVTIIPLGKPDLVITDFKFLERPVKGKTSGYIVDIKNIGTAPVDLADYNKLVYGPCTTTGTLTSCPVIGDNVLRLQIRVYDSPRNTLVFSINDILKKEYASKQVIMPGQTATFTYTRGMYFAKDGEYTVRLYADANNKLEELNERNNRYGERFTVYKFTFTTVANINSVEVAADFMHVATYIPPTGGTPPGSGSGFIVSDVLIGGPNQEREKDVIATFTIKNDLTQAVSGISISSNADSKYDVRFENVPASLNSGAEATVTVKADIPLDFDAVDNGCEASALEIGAMNVRGNNAVQGTSKLKMQAENHLEIRKLEVELPKGTDSIRDREDVEVGPREELKLSVQVRNTFNDNTQDYEIEGDVKVIPEEDGDKGLDLDDEEEDFELDAEDDETLEFSGSFGSEVDDGKLNVKVKACGTDENGARHGEILEFQFDVEKEKEALSIERLKATPSVTSCDETVTISFTVYNDGKHDERDISYVVEGLGERKEKDEIEIDEGESRGFTETFKVNDERDGPTDFTVSAYIDGNLMTQEDVTVTLKDCEEIKKKEEVIPPKATPKEEEQSLPAPKAAKKTFRDSPWYFVFLITAIVTLVGMTSYFGYLIYKKEW